MRVSKGACPWRVGRVRIHPRPLSAGLQVEKHLPKPRGENRSRTETQHQHACCSAEPLEAGAQPQQVVPDLNSRIPSREEGMASLGAGDCRNGPRGAGRAPALCAPQAGNECSVSRTRPWDPRHSPLPQ